MADIPTDGWVDAPAKAPTEGWKDEAAADAEPGQGKILGNVGQDDQWGRTKNAATSGIKGLIGAGGGMLGDIGNIIQLVRTGTMQEAGDKRSHEEIMRDDEVARERAAMEYANHRREYLNQHPEIRRRKPGSPEHLEPVVSGHGPFGGKYAAPLPATTQDLYNEFVKPRLGEYEPQTPEGRIGSFAVTGLTGGGAFSNLGKIDKATRIAREAPTLAEHAINFLRGTKPATIGAGAGAASGAAEEMWHNPYITTATALGTPVAAETAASVAGKAGFMPRTREDAARAAGKRMVKDIEEGGEKPADVLSTAQKTYDTLPEWHTEESAPTLAEAGKSRALAQSETAARMTNAGVDSQIMARNAEREQARQRGARSTVDETATGDEPGQAFKQFAEDLDKRVEETLPKGDTSEEVGGTQRQVLEQNRKAAEEARTQLYDDLEQRFGDQTILLPGLKAAAGDLTKHRPGFTKKRAPDEHTQMAIDMPNEVKFGDLRAYLKDLNLEIANTRSNPTKTAELGQLKRLKSGVMDDIQQAVANWEAHDQELAARGDAVSNGTVAQSIQRQFDAWRASRDAAERTASVGAGPTGGSAGISGVGAPTSGAGPQRGGAPGAGGPGAVPGGSGRIDPAAKKALDAANAAQVYLGKTFREGPAGDILGVDRFGNWNKMDSEVPRAAFPGGPDGYTITQKVLEAGEGRPEMVGALKDTAIATLRAELKGGRLTPQALERWQKKYETSLRAIDEVEPGFSDQFANLANTQSAMAAKFAGAQSTTEAANLMGKMLNAPDGASQLARLIKEAGPEPAIAEGFKKLIIDHMFDQAERSAGATGNVSNYIRAGLGKYGHVMESSGLFDAQHMQVLRQVADDLANQQQHTQNLKGGLPGSPTQTRAQLLRQRFQEPEAPQSAHLAAPFAVGTLLREGGIEALKQWAGIKAAEGMARLAHRMKVRNIRSENDLYKAGMVDPQLGLAMLRHGVEGPTSPTWIHRVGEALRASPLYAQPGLEEDEKRREGRASGGRVQEAAQHLVKMVEHARKRDTTRTKPLLQQDDSMVAHALEIAGKHI